MMKTSKTLPFTALVLIVMLLSMSIFYSCGANLFSTAEDVKIGQDLDREILSKPNEFPILTNNPEINTYVSDLGHYILNSSPKIEYKNVFPYKFQVVNDTIVNAFCTPGGFIYVYTGLMKFVDNEATLAGVMAHEIAHAELRHMTQRLTSYYGMNILMGFLLGSNPNAFAEIAANLFVGLGFLANSRSDEQEADDYSIKYLMTSKYYPGGITYFFDKILKDQQKAGTVGGGFDRLLATHPLPQDRIQNVKDQMKTYKRSHDSTKGIYYDEYQIIKSKLN